MSELNFHYNFPNGNGGINATLKNQLLIAIVIIVVICFGSSSSISLVNTALNFLPFKAWFGGE